MIHPLIICEGVCFRLTMESGMGGICTQSLGSTFHHSQAHGYIWLNRLLGMDRGVQSSEPGWNLIINSGFNRWCSGNKPSLGSYGLNKHGLIIDDTVPSGDHRTVPLLDVNSCWNIIRRIEYGEIRKKVARLLAKKTLSI